MKFGSREICNVVFKTTTDHQKIGNLDFAKTGTPCFMIDTAKTSSLEQATTTVYATGGRGNTRLLTWEGEKTMTFTVEDALISPMGLAVLSGAGLYKATEAAPKHAHVTVSTTATYNSSPGTLTASITYNDIANELGIDGKLQTGTLREFYICAPSSAVPMFATVIDGSGAGIDWLQGTYTVADASATPTGTDPVDVVIVDNTPHNATVTITPVSGESFSNYSNGATIILDFYVVLQEGVTEIEIKPEDFGGFFYVEAQTLFRREDSGKDMAAEIILPKVKVQSGFTFSMASTGDPSTFTFTMDAMPGYTYFDKTKKVMCVLQVLGTDATASTSTSSHPTHVAQG